MSCGKPKKAYGGSKVELNFESTVAYFSTFLLPNGHDFLIFSLKSYTGSYIRYCGPIIEFYEPYHLPLGAGHDQP